MSYEQALASRIGNRERNEDRCAIEQAQGAVLLVLADGMGGHPAGALAAQVAVDSLVQAFREVRKPIEDPHGQVTAGIATAHRAVVAAGQRQHPPVTPYTTVVTALVQWGQAWWAHLGDSRLYLLRRGRILVRTRDHSHVEALVAAGVISEGEALRHPQRNLITRSLGGDAPCAAPSHGQARIQEGDVLLLCSDGLWGPLSGETLAAALADGALQPALDALCARAERAGAPHSDNVSAVALRCLG
jgi:PPM family protein phosphatase